MPWTAKGKLERTTNLIFIPRQDTAHASSVSAEPPEDDKNTIHAEQLRLALHAVMKKFPAAAPGIQWLVLHLNGINE